MIRRAFILLSALAVSVSCSRSDSAEGDTAGHAVTSIYVSSEQAQTAPGIETADAADDSAPIIIDKFKAGDKLYFAQLGPTVQPNFENLAETASPYIYIYEYFENDKADWNAGYNFSLQNGRKAFDWETVRNMGSVGNAFSLYAFHFPVDNKVRFKVETDQRGSSEDDRYDKSNFMKSDIMGAYHATSSLYTRLRFRLFHLMVYLKVTLYVPEYNEQTPDDQNPYKDMKYSGFNAGAMRGAYVLNADTELTVEWRAKRSSDSEAPLTQASGSKSNIIMYAHRPDEDVIQELDISKFYDKNVEGIDGSVLRTDRVRAYTFSVLFPSQTFSDNFLCFELEAADGTRKYYYFSGIVGDSGNYSLTQGSRQELWLYLPRTTNETILVGANILPWSDAVTDMTVTKQEEEGN